MPQIVSNITFPFLVLHDQNPQNKLVPGLSGFGVVGVVVLRISAQSHATGCNAATKRSSGENDIELKLALNGGTMLSCFGLGTSL